MNRRNGHHDLLSKGKNLNRLNEGVALVDILKSRRNVGNRSRVYSLSQEEAQHIIEPSFHVGQSVTTSSFYQI